MILHTFAGLPFGAGTFLGGTASYFPLLNFEAALVATLKADADIAAIVDDRVYPLAIPQRKPGQNAGKLPCLVYAITNTERARNHAGPAGIAVARVLIDARSNLYSDVKALQEALRAYDGFRGYLANSVVVLNTRMEDQGDEFEWPGGTGADQGTHHLTLEFRFKYRESILI